MPRPSDLYRAEVAAQKIRADPSQERAINALDDLYESISEPQVAEARTGLLGVLKRKPKTLPVRKQGVYLHGPVGRGKTYAMDLFVAAIPDATPKKRVHFHRFMLDVHDFLHKQRIAGAGAGVDNILPKFADDLARTCRILCFDEFDVTDVADAMILKRLFTVLLAAGIRVVMTSNRAPDDLYKGGLQRDLFLPFIALLKEKMEIIAVDGGRDYRLARLSGHRVYFHPLGAAAAAEVTAIFTALTDHAAAHKQELTVKGHTLVIPQAARGVARASFTDLCEKAFAAQDYLALADHFHTLILENVPRLNYDRRNEARRLITLIDIWYEQRKRLVITAEAPPDKLYVMGDHAFEFQRSVSRLMEMQAVGWGT